MTRAPITDEQGFIDALAGRKYTALDRRINALVYELYGLTDEEVALVERGSP